MSIEDINYLYKNSIKDNAIIFIESHKRNRDIYSTPSEYTITFDNPFKYVYGVEVLDASIPRTMYQIDKTNNNLKVVMGDANYHIYKTAVYNNNNYVENTFASNNQTVTNQNWQGNYGNIGMNYINSYTETDTETGIESEVFGTTLNSGQYGNNSLLWLRDITLDPQDMNIDTFINNLNKKFGELPLSIGNADVSIANNKKLNFRAVSNPATSTSKILIYSGSDADNNGIITDTIPFYILTYNSNMAETLGFDENALSVSNDYTSDITDLEKRNIFMLLNNISIEDWNIISKQYIDDDIYNKEQWEGVSNISGDNPDNPDHPFDSTRNALNNRDRTLLVLQKLDEFITTPTNYYNDFITFENESLNKIFKSNINKGDVGKYNLSTNVNNEYNSSYPDFNIPKTIEFFVKWNDEDNVYEFKDKIIRQNIYPTYTFKPELTFILGNTYKFDISDSSNDRRFCFIKYYNDTESTGISDDGNDNKTIRIYADTEYAITMKSPGSITGDNEGYYININVEPKQYFFERVNSNLDSNGDSDTIANNEATIENLVSLLNAIPKYTNNNDPAVKIFKATKVDNTFIYINLLQDTIPKTYNSTIITTIEISNFDFTPQLNFSYNIEDSEDSEDTDTSIITSNIIRSGTPGTSGSYVQITTVDNDFGATPNAIFGTPNNFYYLSVPVIDNTTITSNGSLTGTEYIFDPHTTSGNSIALQRSSVHRIQTPGMINLTGERLITLKSKIIEENLYKNESGTSSIGIALFKVGTSGFTDNRLDFTNFKPKDFHPIGKLTHIDFRFEIDNNVLYDFKGVNHNLLLNIKYFVPHKIIDTLNYTLNSNYNPDFINYKKLQYEKDDDSEEELEELAQDFGNNFLNKEKEYVYSSDEDLEYVEKNNNDITDSDTSESSEEDEYEPSNKNNMTPFHPMYNM